MLSTYRLQFVFVAFLLVLPFSSSLEVLAQAKLPAKPRPHISTDQFTFLSENQHYSVSIRLPKGTQSIPIPAEWLAPAQELAEEEDQPFSTVHYSKHVTSFPIGNGEIALQFSSFDMMTGGSMMGAGGRDVFLIFNPADASLRPGLINLGITKERARDGGCFRALMTHFLIADANDDGSFDIGTVQEEIKCPEGEDWMSPPHYVQHDLHWYLFTPEGWKKEETVSSWTDDYVELPLVDIRFSPVDFVAEVLWGTSDSSKWMSPPLYTPAYRKKLLREERRKSQTTIKDHSGPPGSGPSRRLPMPEQPASKPNQQLR